MTKILDEIVRKKGPLDISDIIYYGKSLGLSFQGQRSERANCRAILTSSKRFQHLGDGVYDVAFR